MLSADIIGVDLGGTKVNAALVRAGKVERSCTLEVSAKADQDTVLNEVIAAIEKVMLSSVTAIGVGVPSVVDVDQGVVYNVQNIPSWQRVPLQEILSEIGPYITFIDNDANCFANGEHKLGIAKGFANMVGLVIGTGSAAGIIIDHTLYQGNNCGAGEFGMIPYKEHHYEHYCSGQFFPPYFQKSGEQLYEMATEHDPSGLEAFKQFGHHMGHLISTILYSIDPQMIVLGGSVSKSFAFFKDEMWKVLSDFVYEKTVNKLQIEVSQDPDIAVLGAASLCHKKLPI